MHFRHPLIYLSLALGLASCSETSSTVASGAGYLQIDVNVNPSLTIASTGEVVRLDSLKPDVEEFSLRITSADGQYGHKWASVSDFDPTEPIAPGDYLIEVSYGEKTDDGYSRPYYSATATATVTPTLTTPVKLEAEIANTFLGVEYTCSFTDRYPTGSVTLHTSGCAYISMLQAGNHTAFLTPGDLDISLNIPYEDEMLHITPASVLTTLPGYFYELTVDMGTSEQGDDAIILSFDEGTDADDIVIPLTESFLRAPSPTVETHGFSADEPYKIAEGTVPELPVTMSITSDNPLQKVILTTVAPSLTLNGWPAETDLLTLGGEESALMESLGFKMNRAVTEDSLNADFTDVLANLRLNDSQTPAYFILHAVDINGKASEPISLKVDIEPVEVVLMNVSSSIAGIDEAEIMIQSSTDALRDNLTLKILEDDRVWTDAAIISLTQVADNRYSVRFKVPSGNDDIKFRLYYCGTLRAEHTIDRISPVFTLTADAFALKTVLKVMCDDEEMARYITSRLSVFNGNERMTISERDTERCTVTVTGLSGETTYRLNATLLSAPTDAKWIVPVTFITEEQGTLANGDFEEIKSCISYKNLLCGGRYSQSFIEIFNMQNHTQLDLSAPIDWATTNPKTFCEGASNHNTWYLEPSVYTVKDVRSGAYAVKLTSVAWDINGMDIPAYLQQSEPFKRYSDVIPDITYRAVGKLFLGSYSFNPKTLEETYNEGVSFISRPSALNGYYSYRCGTEMPGDRGLARIELIGIIDGQPTTIAQGEAMLVPSEGYTAFSIPLNYEYFGVKATRLKVMFASSVQTGDIATESQTIVTTPDPVTATSVGSQLWLDDVNLSY